MVSVPAYQVMANKDKCLFTPDSNWPQLKFTIPGIVNAKLNLV